METRVSLVLLDVEGVLVRPGGGHLPWPLEDLLEVRRLLEDPAPAVALCTGRQQPYAEAMIQTLGLFYCLDRALAARVREAGGPDLLAWPSIAENGAYFYDPLAKRAIPHPALTHERIETLRRLRTEALLPLVRRTGAVMEAGKDLTVSINPPPVAPGSAERLAPAAFRPEVEAAISGHLPAVEIRHNESAIDITPRGVSKASAVRLLLEWTGLAPEEVLGVGDTQADEAWLQVVRWRAAPANGRSALPGLDYYASREVAQGLLEILRRLRGNGCRGLS